MGGSGHERRLGSDPSNPRPQECLEVEIDVAACCGLDHLLGGIVEAVAPETANKKRREMGKGEKVSGAPDVCFSLRSTPTGSLTNNSIGAEGAKHISEGLKANKALTTL